ncbi:hypothetical protein [Mycolicibacterium helvum]|uniref:Glycosyltransferase RgtA/B/C/D-like domain-containing protein n=1 Tax=Mycolicibacterium helvum TaxID=1534349 RepID=A0A7I7T376_9MYCO|nr:hypothetical protein [Mycolicibacterium helvum]BBY63353.1 hypothetical protein MHEL_15960 [Mycolicibacterium helvum]
MTRGTRFSDAKIAAFITAALFVLYVCTLSRTYFGDGLQFALLIENGDLESILAPNHMLYPLIGLGFYRAWQIVGWDGGALLPLQVLSAVGGAGSAGMMYLIGVKITRSQIQSAWVAAIFAVSAGVWVYSTDAESVTLPLLFSLLLLYAIVADRDPARLTSPLILGALVFLSLATYETGILLVVPVLAGYLLATEMTWRLRARQSLLFILFSGGPSLILYVLVAVIVARVRSLQGFLDWHFALSEMGLWGKPSLSTPVKGAIAVVKNLGGYPGMQQESWPSWFSAAATGQRALMVLSTVAISAAFLFSIVLIVRRRRFILDHHRRTLGVFLAWIAVYSAFAFYWVASDPSFWTPALVPWWLLIGIAVFANTAPEESAEETHGPWTQGVRLVAVFMVVFLLALLFSIAPRMRPDCANQVTMSIGRATGPNDLVITSGWESYFLTVPYLAHRNTISVYHWMLNSVPDSPWAVRPTQGAVIAGRRSKADVFNEIAERASDVRERGGKVLLVGVPAGQKEWSFAEAIGLHKEDFSFFTTRPGWTVCGEDVLEVTGTAHRTSGLPVKN